VTDPKTNAGRARDLRRLADGLTNPKDAELVRAYANELAAAVSVSRKRHPFAGHRNAI
jgi:hypothetical protein